MSTDRGHFRAAMTRPQAGDGRRETVGKRDMPIGKRFPENKNTQPGARNDHRVEQVIAALLTSRSVHEASQKVGMGYRTLKEWLRSEKFRTQYEDAKRELLEQTINMLRSAGWKGVTTLEEVATNKKAAPTARAMAARGLLEVLLRAVETQDLASRLERLEAVMNKKEADQ